MCASSYPIFDEIFSHNIGKDKDGYPNELKDVWITLNFFWSIFRIAHTMREGENERVNKIHTNTYR